MKSIYNYDFSKSAPSFLRDDSAVGPFIKMFSNQMQKFIKNFEKVLIFCNIDNLPENILDILAYDLHIDWYDCDYSIEKKRVCVKESIIVHSKLGTAKSVISAIKAVLPDAEITEWFSYGGKPKRFKIEVNNATVTMAQIEKVVKDIEYTKKLSAVLDKLILNTEPEPMQISSAIYIHTGEIRTLQVGSDNRNYPLIAIAGDSLVIASDDDIAVEEVDGNLIITADDLVLSAENGRIYCERED